MYSSDCIGNQSCEDSIKIDVWDVGCWECELDWIDSRLC